MTPSAGWRPAPRRSPRARLHAAWLAAALLALAAPRGTAAQAPADTTAAGVVRTFYAFHATHGQAFTPGTVRRRARWLSPQLLARCRAYFAKPRPADEVPPIDGDPFTDSQDYPQSHEVGAASVAGDTAVVGVTLAWPDGNRVTVKVVLTRAAAAWRIADVRYANGSSFTALLASDD